MKEEYSDKQMHKIKKSERKEKGFKAMQRSQLEIQNKSLNNPVNIQNIPKQILNNCNFKQNKTNQELKKVQKLEDMRVQKLELKQKLKQLKLQQNKNGKKNKIQLHRLEQSQEIGNISGIVRNFKKFQKQLQQKTSQYEEQLIFAKMKMNEQEIKIKQLQKQKRLKISQQNLQIIKQRQETRKMEHQQSVKALSVLRTNKPLFEKMNDRWKSMEQEQKQEVHKIYQSIKKSKIINGKQIIQHEQKYDQILKQNRVQRQEKRRQRQQVQSLHFQSPFYQQIKRQQQQRIKLTEERQLLPKIKRQRIKKYQKLIRQQIQPHIKTSQNKTESQRSDSQSRFMRILTTDQLHAKGNLYMKKAHENLDRDKPSKQSLYQTSSPKPRNYLKQLQIQNKPSNKSYHKPSQASVVKSIIDSQNIHSQSTIQKLRQVIDTVQNRSTEKKGTNSVYEAMQLKLNVLSKYYENN